MRIILVGESKRKKNTTQEQRLGRMRCTAKHT